MKHYKRLLAVVLALVMILSCVGTAFAADKTEITEISKTAKTERSSKELKGFKSQSFKETNLYQYAEDEQVRVIVVLEGAPEIDVVENDDSTKAISYRAKLNTQHNNVRKAMNGISFTPGYDFTTLLNGFSCDVAYGDLDEIAAIDGVEAVYIANHYAEPVLTEPTTESSGWMTGNRFMPYFGVTGAGTVIAVLDTGLLTTHEAFQVYDESAFADAKLTQADATLAVANGTYVSEKVPFAYDYADKDADVTDQNGHGTHVAGIATGYVEADDGAITFSGAAPEAQLLAMKIFYDEQAGTTSDIYLYAIEDAYRLGADVINMSIGAPSGFTYDAELESEVFGNIYTRMEQAGVIMCVSAGNESSMNEFSTQGYTGPDYTDYGVISSPGSYEGNISIASIENESYPQYVMDINGYKISYVDSSDTGDLWRTSFALTYQDGALIPYDYVIVTDPLGGVSLGTAEDFASADVDGKIAVVQRGELNFEDKMNNAADAGAIGCIVINNDDSLIAMSIETFTIPAISVTHSAGEILKTGSTLTVLEDLVMNGNAQGWLMSGFSSWGTSPDLTIDPAATSVGGNVYSSVSTGTDAYDVYSGTSMAAPNAAGTFANILQYLMQDYPDMSKVERAETARALLLGTAEIIDDEDGYPYSVRKQGAGLMSAPYAAQAISGSVYVANPLHELGDDPEKTGTFSFDVELVSNPHPDAMENLYIEIQGIALHDYIADANSDPSDPLYFNTLTTDYFYSDEIDISYTIEGQEVTSFNVAKGESVTVTVTLTLTEIAKEYLDEVFTNGSFVEGYIIFDDMNPETGEVYSSTHATFLGYYGDWTDGEVLESEDFRDYVALDYDINTIAADADGNTFADYGYTPYDFMSVVTDFNIAYLVDSYASRALAYAGDNLLDYAPYSEKHIAFSTEMTDGTYYYADLLYMIPYQLRNARHLIMTVSDAQTGEVYYVDDTEYLPKASYDEENGYWDSFGVFTWDGTDLDGNYVPSGTVANVRYDAVLSYGEAEQENCWSFDVTVDYTAPVIESAVMDEEAQTLTVTASDENYLQAIYLADEQYNILDFAIFSSEEKGASFTATFDVSGIDTQSVLVTALDYATNEIEEETFLFETGLPIVFTFNTPAGSTELELESGDIYTFEDCAEFYEGYRFECWTTTEVEQSEDGSDITGDFYYEGDQLLAKEDMTFYALYAKGEVKPLDPVDYYLPANMDDYTGLWAIVGFNVDEEGDFVTDLPIAMDDAGEPVDVVNDLNATVSDQYLEFFTNELSIRFLCEDTENGYTFKNVETEQYIALVDGALAFVDEPADGAYWTLEPGANDTIILNATYEDMLLTYDDEAGEFAIYDNSVPLLDLGFLIIYPSDYYCTFLYRCLEEDFVVEFYTTKVAIPVPGCHVSEFIDCPAKWYHEAIDYVVSKGLMTGVGDGKFDPDGTMTRAMMVTVLYRMVGEPPVSAPSSFIDVPQGEWYSDAIAWAQDNGIVLGVLENEFAPTDPVTREQIATIFWRYAGSPDAEADLSAFSDTADISEYAKVAMAWAVSEGLIQGDGGKLKPADHATRAEFATIIMRYLGGSYDCPTLQ